MEEEEQQVTRSMAHTGEDSPVVYRKIDTSRLKAAAVGPVLIPGAGTGLKPGIPQKPAAKPQPEIGSVGSVGSQVGVPSRAAVDAGDDAVDAVFAERERAAARIGSMLARRDPKTGWTLLHLLAALGADRELAALLSHPMCPLEAIAPHGCTALDHARIRGKRVAARMLFCAMEQRRSGEAAAKPLAATAGTRQTAAASKGKAAVATGATARKLAAVAEAARNHLSSAFAKLQDKLEAIAAVGVA